MRKDPAAHSKYRGVRTTRENFLERAVAERGDQYSYDLVGALLSGGDSLVTITCREHGPFEQRVCKHLEGQGCPRCARNQRLYKSLNGAQLVARLDSVHGVGHYEYLVDVVDPGLRFPRLDKIEFVCPKEGHGRQSKRVGALLTGGGCEACKESNGERVVRRTLVAAGVAFEAEVKFADLEDKGPLRFDFRVASQKVLIEFDGGYHNPPRESWNFTPEQREKRWADYEVLHRHDLVKNAYAAENGWALIRLGKPGRVLAELRAHHVIPGCAHNGDCAETQVHELPDL